MSAQEIQTAIVELPPGELANLIEWIEEYNSDAWDRQIAKDVEAGHSDSASESSVKRGNADRYNP